MMGTADVVVCMVTASRPNGLLYPRAVYDSLHRKNNKTAVWGNDMRLMVVYADMEPFPLIASSALFEKEISLTSLHLREELGCPSLTEEDSMGGPPCKVQQQGLDFVVSLQACGKEGRWVLLLEDDMEACDDGALQTVQAVLSSLHPNQTLLARFAREPGVFAIPSQHIPFFAQEMRMQLLRKPVDHVLYTSAQWGSMPSKPQYIHSSTLFRHIGHVSTFSYRNLDAYHAQYDGMRMGSTCGEPLSF
jgi:hypothetical protein